MLGIEDAANFHLAIGTDDGIGINGEIDGYAADGRKLVSDGHSPGGDGGLHLVDQLPVDRDATARVEAEGELGVSGFGLGLHNA